MRIAIVGAHRVGKSTLAKLYGDKHKDTPYIPCSFSNSYEKYGLKVGDPETPEQRLAMQMYALSQWLDMVLVSKGRFVVDRSPIDFAAYCLYQANELGDPKLYEAAEAFAELCVNTAKMYTDVVLYISPGIDVMEEAKSWSSEKSIRGIDSLICKLLSGFEEVWVIGPNMLDLDHRLDFLETAVCKVSRG